MGVSTNGQICFGIAFEECECPWDETHEGDIDEWWYDTCEGKPPALPDEDGNWTEYFKKKRAFDKAYPLPVELVNYCSMGSPMYIIAVPDSCINASRGYPTTITPEMLTVTIEQVTALTEFCDLHLSDCNMADPAPKWYLSSYWEQ